MRFAPMACLLSGLVACSHPSMVFDERSPDTGSTTPMPIATSAEIQRGQYLVTLLGCGTCHTDGALTGQANSKYLLAGSNTGIAVSDPMRTEHPGLVFPANLTPDPATGLGHWSETDIVLMLKAGADRHGIQQSTVMPWAAYAQLKDEDALAIARYLKSLPPVAHKVPAKVRPGQPSKAPHIYFGVYQKH